MIGYLTFIASIVAACAALYAAYVSEEKLRLDLYNKRWAIYSVTRDFYEILLQWKDADEYRIKYEMFTATVLESRFLFKSPVCNKLQEMRQNANLIITSPKLIESFGAGTPEAVATSVQVSTALAYWNKSIEELIDLMFEYLDFQEVSPRKAIIKELCKKWQSH